MEDLQLRVLKKFKNSMLHSVPLIDDSLNKKFHNQWSQAIHPPTIKLNPFIENKYLIGPLLEWLRHFVASNMEVMKFVS